MILLHLNLGWLDCNLKTVDLMFPLSSRRYSFSVIWVFSFYHRTYHWSIIALMQGCPKSLRSTQAWSLSWSQTFIEYASLKTLYYIRFSLLVSSHPSLVYHCPHQGRGPKSLRSTRTALIPNFYWSCFTHNSQLYSFSLLVLSHPSLVYHCLMQGF